MHVPRGHPTSQQEDDARAACSVRELDSETLVIKIKGFEANTRNSYGIFSIARVYHVIIEQD